MGGGAANSEVIPKLYIIVQTFYRADNPPKLPNLNVHSLHELFLFHHLG